MKTKKNLEIIGQPVYPITIGQYAWIRERDGVRRTSPVVCLEQVTQSEVRFETMNTLYHLQITAPEKYEAVKHA